MAQTIESPAPAVDWTRNVDCVHVDCIGGGCRYRPEPPEIGPPLPRQIRDCNGDLWTRHEGRCFYKRLPGGGYALVTWNDLHRGRSLLSRSEFPFDGPWTVRLVEFFGWPQVFAE